MRFKACVAAAMIAMLAAGCGSSAKQNAYAGKGGMTASDIKPEVYLYHYQHGFTGDDAIGWDPNLQYAWSRLGAAKTCGIPFDQDRVLRHLVKQFEVEKWVHEANGIGFHHKESQAITGFCTPERINEIKEQVPQFERGEFPQRH